MIVTTSRDERMQYLNARVNIKETAGVSQTAIANAVLTQSYLRLIQPLVPNQNAFNFPVLYNQSGSGLPARPDEYRLKLQDAFYVSKLTAYIFIAESATSYNYRLQTWPNKIVFPVAGAVAGGSSLNVFYNGMTRITINNSVITPAYPNIKYLNIPQTQLTAAANSPEDQLDGSTIMPWEPNIVLVGSYDSQVNIVLPGPMTAMDNFVYAMIEIEGVLAQNVAVGAVK